MDERDLGIGDLPRTAFAAQLAYRLSNRKHRTGMTGMAMREQAAVRIDRQFAAKLDASVFDEAAAFALGAEAEVFELDDDDRREAIVKLGDVDIFRRQSRHRKGARARLFGRRGS